MYSKKQPVFYYIKTYETEKRQKKGRIFGHFGEKYYFCAAKIGT